MSNLTPINWYYEFFVFQTHVMGCAMIISMEICVLVKCRLTSVNPHVVVQSAARQHGHMEVNVWAVPLKITLYSAYSVTWVSDTWSNQMDQLSVSWAFLPLTLKILLVTCMVHGRRSLVYMLWWKICFPEQLLWKRTGMIAAISNKDLLTQLHCWMPSPGPAKPWAGPCVFSV